MPEEDTNYQKTQAEAYCNHVMGLAHRKETDYMNYEEALDSIDMLKAVRYDREGSGGGMQHGDDAIAAKIDELMRYGDAMLESIAAWTDEQQRFASMCRRMTPLYSRVLTSRYAKRMKWDEVAGELGMEPEYVRGDLKNKALVELYSLLPLSWK